MKRIIGLTGSIATGKSTVAKLFMDEGIYVIDSDILAKHATEQKHVIEEIVEAFGSECLDEHGKLDRAYVAEEIFSDKDKQKQLNAIVHPYVKEHITQMLDRRKNELVVVDVPLMYETDFHEMMDEIIVVYATEEQEIDRLMHRNNLSHERALARIHAQMPIDEKVKLAHYVLDNSGTKMELYANFRKILRELKEHLYDN